MRTFVLFAGFITASVFALSCSTPAFAQYKYLDANGKTVYSDQPPPPDARNVARKDFDTGAASVDSSRMPYELRRAVQAAPVTLYTVADCAPCEQGRQYLNARGVPFVEKTIAGTPADLAALTSLGLSNNFPAVAVGPNKLSRFSSQSWGAALDAASYPTSAPPAGSYVNPPPTPLVSPAAQAAASGAPQPAAPSPPRPATSTTPDNPAGIRF